MRSTISIDIDAPPSVIFDLACDVERWSTLLPHYRRSRSGPVGRDAARITAFVAIRPFGPVGVYGMPVAWRARTWSEPDLRRLRFVHLGGATAGMDVTWHIEPSEDGSRVTIEHEFPAPPAWAAFVDRLFTRPIAGRTLATFKALAEAVAGTVVIDTSVGPPRTNPRT